MAKEILQIRNVGLTPINVDNAEWDLDPSVVTGIVNVRFNFGRVVSYSGFRDLTQSNIPAQLRWMLYTGGNDDFILSCGDAVLAFDGSNWDDIGIPAAYNGVDIDSWSGGLLGTVPVINASGTFPQYWPDNNTAVALEYLPWDGVNTWEDVGNSCRILRTYKQFCIAMDMQEGANEFPDVVRWSNPADAGDVPASWDETDPSNLAGRNVLSGNLGAVIDGMQLRDTFVIYRERGITVMDFVGGQFVFNFRNFTSTFQLAGTNCIAEVEGKHFYLTANDIVVNDGNNITSVLQNRARSFLLAFADVTDMKNAYIIKNDDAKELLFCIASPGQTYPNAALIYNWHDKTWGAKLIENNPHGIYVPILEPSTTWSSAPGTWDSQTLFWSNSGNGGTYRDVVMLGSEEEFGVPSAWEDMVDDWDAIPDDWASYGTSDQVEDEFPTLVAFGFPNRNREDRAFVGRDNIAIGGMGVNITVTRVYPLFFDGSGAVMVRVGAQDYVNGPIRWKPAVEFNPATDRKIDVRVTGELIAYEVYSESDTTWQFGGMDLEWTPAGRR